MEKIGFGVSPPACAGLLPGCVSTRTGIKEGQCCLSRSGLGTWQPLFTLAQAPSMNVTPGSSYKAWCRISAVIM